MSISPKPISPKARPHSKDDQFDTSHLNRDINKRATKGGLLTIGSQAANFVLKIASTAILARLLAPEDFGLIAMVSVVTAFFEMLNEGGLAMATVQKEKVSHGQVSNLFWANILLSVTASGLICASAPLVSIIYGEPRLTLITVAFAGMTFVRGLTIQHRAIMRRKMEFGRLVVIEVTSTIAGIVVGCVMAWKGYGYWSLVAMPATSAVTVAILTLAWCRWLPSLPARKTGIRPMLAFGGYLTGAKFFRFLSRHADNLVIGVMHGAGPLGIYSRGYNLFMMPTRVFLTPLSGVMIPTLSRLVDNPERYRQVFLEKSYVTTYCVVFANAFSFAAAPELTRIVLGPSWDQVALIVRLLALGGAITATNVASSWVCTAHGWGRRQLNTAMISGPVFTAGFLIGGFFGPEGVACAFSLVTLLLRYPFFRYLLKDSPISPKDIYRQFTKIAVPVTIVAGLSMAIASLGASKIVYSLPTKAGIFAIAIAALHFSKLLPIPNIRAKD